MALSIPEKLKSADISRFAQRAAQVESLKPALAYWCYYWIVQQILGNGLHTADDAAKAFTMNLMDRLEEMKVQHATDDSIIDDMAGQAYVEQFGLETFQRADNAVRANKATRQTADTFQAAATFLELVNIWGTPSPELLSKIKYAKFHALRIAKALKSGEDPNLSNPAEPDGDAVPLDPNDPEVRKINGSDSQSLVEATIPQSGTQDSALGPSAHIPREPTSTSSPKRGMHPSVAEFPDGYDRLQRSLAGQSTLDESLHPSRASSIPRPPLVDQATDTANSNVGHVSPLPIDVTSTHVSLLPSQSDSTSRQDSVGGGYFPSVSLPDAPMGLQDAPPLSAVSDVPGDPNLFPDDPSRGNVAQDLPFSAPIAGQQAHPQHSILFPQQPPNPRQAHQQTSQLSSPQPSLGQSSPNIPQKYLTDDAAVMAAQKHAKFAISALNFEDVPTAVKELREALQSLGAI